MNYIYGYRNKINDKWYVGQTTMDIKERHRLHLSSTKNEATSDYNTLFHKKIRQYGIENFDLIILEEVSEKHLLDSREQYWIKEKNSFVKDNGYNLTTGGQKRKDNEDYEDLRKAFSNEELEDIVNEIKNINIPLIRISEKYGVSLSLICSINSGKKYFNNQLSYPIRPFVHSKISDKTIDLIIYFLKQNYSNKEISEILKIDDDIVYRINYGLSHIKNDLDYPIRKINYKKERADKIKQLLKENKLNNKQIALLVKCDPSVVSNINYGKSYRDENIIYPIR